MLSAVNQLISTLFGSVFVSWISTDVFMYLFGIIFLGLIIHYVISIIHF